MAIEALGAETLSMPGWRCKLSQSDGDNKLLYTISLLVMFVLA